MKKLIIVICIILIALPLCISNASQQEDFTFRNGIRFGDDKETVKSKEEDPVSYEYENELRYSNFTLSGIQGSVVEYGFAHDKLESIMISYREINTGSDSMTQALQDYTAINEGLIRKYGEPATDSEIVSFPNGAIVRANDLNNNDDRKVTIYKVQHWSIQLENGYKVIIEHVLYSTLYNGWTTENPGHIITYQYFPKDYMPSDIIDNDL